MGEGTGQVIEYEEELVHNVPVVSQNSIMFVPKKVEDNVLHMMTTTVIAPQPTLPSNPAANPLCTLLKVPNALVIKQVHMLSHKLKVAKPQTKLAKACT